MRLRPATTADGPRAQTLIFGVLSEYGLSPDPQGMDTDLRDIEGFYLPSGGMFEVVEDETGRIVGTVGLLMLPDDACELRKMYLDPVVRGQGLGKRLLERAIAHARAHGCRRIVLDTATVLREAISLYERYGFKPIPVEHPSPRTDAAYALELAPQTPRNQD